MNATAATDTARPTHAERVTATIADLKAAQARYRAAERAAAADGFRPERCLHGVNMWVNDFDGACPACEDGDFTPYTRGADLRAYAEGIVADQEAREYREAREDAYLIAECMDDFGLSAEDTQARLVRLRIVRD